MQWLNLHGIGGLKTGKDQDDKPTGGLLFVQICRFPDLRLFQNRPLAVSASAITIGLCSFPVFQASVAARTSKRCHSAHGHRRHAHVVTTMRLRATRSATRNVIG